MKTQIVAVIIMKLESIASDPRQSKKVRTAAKRDADGYRRALAAH